MHSNCMNCSEDSKTGENLTLCVFCLFVLTKTSGTKFFIQIMSHKVGVKVLTSQAGGGAQDGVLLKCV